jgi:hypothetical protein
MLRALLHLLVRLVWRTILERLPVLHRLLTGVVAVVVEVVAAVHVRALKRLLRLCVRILLRELNLRRHDQAEIMFGVLEISFGRDRIAG